MNRYQTQARLACQISIGLMAGAFSIVPVVEASPVQDVASPYNNSDVKVVPGTVTKVTSTTQNNIVAWKDFSVAQGETVQFDGGNKTHNYLNVVTGNATSEIAGKIEGGNDVYLVNPHGVIFSKTAQVDVGNLYVSTQDFKSAVDAYTGGKAGGAVLQAGPAQADIVNLGKIAADKVEADGTHIRFLNSADVTAKSGVVLLNAVGDDAYVHVGVGNAGGTGAGYTSTKGTPIDYYQLVSNATELQNIKNGLGKNYMLSEDIDASGIANFTPLGDETTPFSGKFDGMFYEVQNLDVNTANQFAGLFGVVDGGNTTARIDNVGIVGAKVVTSHGDGEAGALAGSANHVSVANVYSEKGQNGAISAALYAGGLFGYFGDETDRAKTAVLRSSYNTTEVKDATYRGGIAGLAAYGSEFYDVYNTSNSVPYGVARLETIYGTNLPKITRAYTTTKKFTDDDFVVTGGITSPTTSLKTYTAAGWTDGTDISNDGKKNTTWRIYEGQGTPLLTAFLKGTVTASYRYNYFTNPTDQAATTDGLALAGVTGTTDGSDINATYNAQYFKIADSTGKKAGTVSDITFSGGVKAGDNDVVIDSRVYGSGIRNVSDSPGAFLSSTQHGYNIVGGNLNIAKREVKVTGGTYHITREYDGTDDATSALLSAMNGSSSGYQITGLLANDTVELTGITATYQGNGTKGRAAKDADTGKGVTVNAGTVALEDTTGNGSDKNYHLDKSGLTTFSVTGDITPRTLYLTVKKSGFTKVYDGTTDVVTKNHDEAADKNLTIDTTKGAEHQLASVMTPQGTTQDTITFDTSNTTVAYDSKNAGENRNISYENIALTGDNASNYRLVAENAQSAAGYDILYDPSNSTAATGKLTTTGSISQRVIDPTTFSVKDADGKVSSSGTKVYDGKTAFDSTGYTLVAPQAAATGDTGIVAGENITFSIQPGKANFEDENGNTTSQVTKATQIGYDIRAVAGEDTNTGKTTLLSNYVWGKGGKTLTAADTYQVTTPGTITRRALKVEVTQPASVSLDKDYDGTKNIVSTAKYDPQGTYAKAGVFGAQGYVDYQSDSLTLVTDETNKQAPTLTVTAAYDSKDVNRTAAQARYIDYTVKLSGENADNYTINGQTSKVTLLGAQTGAKGVIYPKDLTSSFAPVTKEYDGTTDLPAGQALGGSLAGVISGDDTQLASGATAQFESKDVRGSGTTWTDASGKTWKNWVNYENLSLTGTDALNYDLASSAKGGGTITPLALTADDLDYRFDKITKEYDGTTAISAQNAAQEAARHLLTVTVKADKSKARDVFKGTVAGTPVDHTANVTATYERKDSKGGASQTVNYALTVQDDGSGNFKLPSGGLSVTTQTQGTITPRKVIATAPTDIKKEYDATDAVVKANANDPLISYTHFTADGQPGLVSGDADVSTGVYRATAAAKKNGEQDADAGAKDVLYTLGIQTSDPTNYEIVNANYEIVDASGQKVKTLTGSGTIDKRRLTISFDHTKKAYDGTAAVPQDAAHILPQFDDGAGNAVIKKDGTKAAFDVTQVRGEYHDAAGNKVSDVGTDLAVAYSNLVQALGSHAKNYIVNGGTDAAKGTGDIKKLKLTNLHFSFDVTKEYDGTTDVAYTDRQGARHEAVSFIGDHYADLNGNGTYDVGDVLLGGADKSGLTIQSAQYAGKDAGNQQVTYEIGLGNLNNYDLSGISNVSSGDTTLTFTAQTQGNITPRKVYASLVQTPTAVTKVYDGDTSIRKDTALQNIMDDVLLDGLLAGDGVRLNSSATQATYKDKNAERNKDVCYKIALTGTDAQTKNYKVVGADGNPLADGQLVSKGTGTIEKAPLTIGFGRVEKTFDNRADVTTSSAAGDATTIRPTLKGFVNDEKADFDQDATKLIQGYYTAWDGKTGTPAEDVHVRRDSSGSVVDKAVCYKGIDKAFANLAARYDVLNNYEIAAEPGAQFLASGTNGVKDTVYFSEALHKGRIKPLALAQGQIQEKWTASITKEYDTTDQVLDPEKHFTLYETVTGKDIPITYDLQSAVYDNHRVDQTNGQQVGVTYTINGISQQSLGDFVIDQTTQDAFKNQTYHTTGEITPKLIRAELVKKQDIRKIYDGTADADVKNLVFCDAQGKPLSDDGIYAKDRLLHVNTAVVAAYGDKTATIGPEAAATDKKTVTYTLSLSDPTGNYVLDDQFGSPKTASAQQNIYEGKGDIERRKVFVDFANGQPTGIDKPYDGSDTVDVSKIAGYSHIFATLPKDAQTGVVTVQGTKDDAEVDDASVQAAYQSRHVARDSSSGAPTTQDVYFWNFQLKGKDKDNYIVVANPQSQYARKHGAALAGSGTIRPDQVTVSLKDKNVKKEYDGTTAVVDYTDAGAGGTAHNYLTDNLQWNDAPIVGRGDKLVTNWVQAAFASKDVKGTDGQGNNPVTYEFTWSNDSKDSTDGKVYHGYHDYDVVIASHDGQVTGQGAGATAALTATGVITPRTVKIFADPLKQATRLYDGKGGGAADNAIENLKADNLAKDEKLIDLFLKPGAAAESYLPETVLRSAYDSDPNAGRDGVAIDGDGNALREHTVTYIYTLQNPNYQLDAAGKMDGEAKGKGVIRRRELVLAADPQTMQEGGALPQYTGTIPKGAQTGFVPEDAASEADFLRDVVYAPSAQGAAEPDALFSPQAGRYGIYGWYRVQTGTKTIPAHEVTGADGSVVSVPKTTVPVYAYYRNGNYGTNYMFHQAPANGGALRVERSEQQLPSFGDLDGLNPDRHFRPDRGSYNHATHDELGSATRAPRAGLEYAAGGINAGAAEDAPHGEASLHGEAQLRGEAEVVNLGASGAQRVDLTMDAAGFILTGDDAVRTAPPRIEERTAPVQPEHEADASAAVPRVSGEAPAAGTGDALLWGDSLPAAAASSTAEAPAAGAEDALLWGDSFPAAAAGSTAEAPTLFDDGAGAAAGGAPTAEAGDLPLFDDVPGASPAPSKEAERPADDAISVTTDTTTDDGADEDAQDSAPQREKQIAIESEGAGVNLAG